MAEKSRSLWIWLGCGCAVIVGLGVVAIGAATWLGIRTVQTMKDPVAAQDTALEFLFAETIPAGYDTELAMSIPFFAKVVVLDGGSRNFVFMNGLRTKADLAAAFTDDDSFDRELRRAGLRVGRRQKILARDAVHIGAAEVRYVLFEGGVDFVAGAHFETGHDEDDEAETSAVLLIRCSEAGKPGLGLWDGPRAAEDDAAADRAALVAFIEQFGFCTG